MNAGEIRGTDVVAAAAAAAGYQGSVDGKTVNFVVTPEAIAAGMELAMGGPVQEVRFSNGDKYVGQVRDGKPNGRGTYFYGPSDEKKRKSYEGSFVEGKRHGYGTCLYHDDVYWKRVEGEWRNDLAEGRGRAETKNGTYIGNFSGGTYQGQGTLTYKPGNQWDLLKYEGAFNKGKREGRGVLTWRSGMTYTGDFKNGGCNGQGKKAKADNSWSEEGEYRDGKLMNGTRRVVRWDNGSASFKTHNYSVRDGKEYCCCGICPTCIIV